MLSSGVSAPLITDDQNYHGGFIMVITVFCLVLLLTPLATRSFIFCQWHIVQRDDYLVGASELGCLSWILLLKILHFPLGLKIKVRWFQLFQASIVLSQAHCIESKRKHILTATEDPC